MHYAAADAYLSSHAALLPPPSLLQDMQQQYIDAMRSTLSRYEPAANARAGVPIV